MTPAEILRKARALIDAPEKWTRGALARDADRIPQWPADESATCFCSLGAIVKASGREAGQEHAPDTASRRAMERAIGQNIETWNDDPATTHADVLAAFDRAIALAEQNTQPNPESGRGRR